MTTIDDLDPVLVVHLLSFLPVVQEQLALVATATARCRLVCRQWANVAKDDALWQDICDRTFGLTTRSAPPTLAAPVPAASPTYWDAAKAWLRLHEQLSLGSHFPRMLAPAWTTAVETWHSVEQWTQEHTPAIRRTLAPPAPAASWPHVRSALGFLPDAPGLLQLRVLVALHDGQGLRRDDTLAREAGALPPNASADWSPSAGEDSAAASEEDHVDEPCLGVLGGYSAYDTVCNCRLFPLRLVVAWTRYFRRMCSALPAMRTLVVVGGDWDLQKLVLLDGSTGELWLGQPRGAARTMRLHRALPPARRGGGDELLCWLGELASQMRGGVVR
jgi:cell wall assembly regulator SMI1